MRYPTECFDWGSIGLCLSAPLGNSVVRKSSSNNEAIATVTPATGGNSFIMRLQLVVKTAVVSVRLVVLGARGHWVYRGVDRSSVLGIPLAPQLIGYPSLFS